MTREEAVIILDGFKNNPLFSDTHAQAFDMAISALSENKGEWIPVSERLPDIHNYTQLYLVTYKHGQICTAFFTETNGRCWWSVDDIEAWQPLPSPYKADMRGK